MQRVIGELLKCTLLATAAVISLTRTDALADEVATTPRELFGGVGLIDMPSARFAPDGELSFGGAYFENNQRYSLGFQMFPWLETSFRYAGLQHFDPAYPVYYDRSFALKIRLWREGDWMPAVAVGMNDVVGTGVYGGEYVVLSKNFGTFDATLGMGWGRMGSANTIRNPLGALSSNFYTRNGSYTGLGGDFNPTQYFHGATAGIFGGVDWKTPIDGLTLIGELSSDSYQTEAARGNFHPRNQFNVGAAYQLLSMVSLNVDYLYGRVFGARVNFQLDPTTNNFTQKVGEAAPEPAVRTSEQQYKAIQVMLHRQQPELHSAANKNELVDMLWRQSGASNVEVRGTALVMTVPVGTPAMRCMDMAQLLQTYESDMTTVVLRREGHASTRCATPSAPDRDFRGGVFVGGEDITAQAHPALLTIDARPVRIDTAAAIRAIKAVAKQQSIQIQAVALGVSVATVYYTNLHYFAEQDAIKRLTALLMREAPPDIERFRLISVENGVAMREFDVLRAPQERKYNVEGAIDALSEHDGTTMGPAPLRNPVLAAQRPGFPQFSWSIYPGLRQELFDPTNPVGLQVVASAAGVLSLAPGFSVIGTVETSLFDNANTSRKSDSLLPHVRSDQVLYLAKGSTGIGQLEANYEFRLAPNVTAIARAGYLESMFAGGGGEVLWRPEGQRWALGVDGYEVWQRNFDRLFGLQSYHVLTGHVSLYYASPWYDLMFAARVGRYLAGDRGLTLEVSRRFSTGVEIGAFFTKTNVSAQQFGEGSFDKGIMIRIPLGWAVPIETQDQFNMDLRPIQRDGGQRLNNDALLYNATRRSSGAEIYNVDGED